MTIIQINRLQKLFIVLLITLFSTNSFAEHSQRQNTGEQNNTYITVFENCYFQGKSRSLAVGEYSDVEKLNIHNDSVSSIQIPQGLQITLFEDERFRGNSIAISSSESCLNRAWDNQASSLKVSKSYQSQPYTNNYSPVGSYNSQQLFTTKVSRVWFANSSLDKVADKQWRIVNKNGSVDTFREVNRDGRVIYLQSNRIAQSVQIDLYAKSVQFLVANSKPVNYAIIRSELEKTRSNNLGPVNSASNRNPSRRITNRCFNFKATAYGGEGGIRFEDKKSFERFGKRGSSGRICHDGKLSLEISKTLPSTKVVVEIEGNKYVFAAQEKADVFLNNWYRKIVRLRVGSN